MRVVGFVVAALLVVGCVDDADGQSEPVENEQDVDSEHDAGVQDSPVESQIDAGGDPDDLGQDESPDPTAEDDLPSWFADREPFESCGKIAVDDVVLDNDELKEANACLLEAFEDGDPVEYDVGYRTDEGDEIIKLIRVIGAGQVEVLTDTRQDEFGGTAFLYAECNSLVEERPRRGPWVHAQDCTFDESRTVRMDDLDS